VTAGVAIGGRGLAGESAGDDDTLPAANMRPANFTQYFINDIWRIGAYCRERQRNKIHSTRQAEM
jgi:hypothetical protein